MRYAEPIFDDQYTGEHMKHEVMVASDSIPVDTRENLMMRMMFMVYLLNQIGGIANAR